MAHQLFRNRASASFTRKGLCASFVLLVLATFLIFRQYNPIYSSTRTDFYEQSPPKILDLFLTASGLLIPPKIWQIFVPNSRKHLADQPFIIDPSQLTDTASWIARNPNYHYRLVTSTWADAFVDEHFAAEHPEMAQTYHSLRNPGLKSDLLRYLILYVEGGVYTDIDTVALRPIDEWVPADARAEVRLIVGVEFDQRDGAMWSEIPPTLQFCQWTIAAAPGHPIFMAIVSRAVESVRVLAGDVYGVDVEDLRPTSFEVMNATGPAAWTDVLFEQLQLADPGVTHLKNLSAMIGSRLYGDILVLSIDGFGVGQVHSGSTNDGTYPDIALVKHNFRGSWRVSSDE